MVDVSLLILAWITGLAAVGVLIRTVRLARRATVCRGCEYPMPDEAQTRCPECGWERRRRRWLSRQGRRRTVAIALLALMTVSMLYVRTGLRDGWASATPISILVLITGRRDPCPVFAALHTDVRRSEMDTWWPWQRRVLAQRCEAIIVSTASEQEAMWAAQMMFDATRWDAKLREDITRRLLSHPDDAIALRGVMAASRLWHNGVGDVWPEIVAVHERLAESSNVAHRSAAMRWAANFWCYTDDPAYAGRLAKVVTDVLARPDGRAALIATGDIRKVTPELLEPSVEALVRSSDPRSRWLAIDALTLSYVLPDGGSLLDDDPGVDLLIQMIERFAPLHDAQVAMIQDASGYSDAVVAVIARADPGWLVEHRWPERFVANPSERVRRALASRMSRMGAWPDAVELLSQRLLYDEMPYVFDVTCRSLRMLSITEPELVESILVAYRRASTDPDRLATLERRAVLDR